LSTFDPQNPLESALIKYKIAGIAFAALSAFVGCLLPFVSFGLNLKEPTNLIWGFVYGLGWYAAALLSDPKNPSAQLFGGKIWPFLVVGAIVYASGRLRKTQNPTRSLIAALLVLSLLAVIPHRLTIGTTLDDIPTYCKMLTAAY
jgi:hypothetical protein